MNSFIYDSSGLSKTRKRRIYLFVCMLILCISAAVFTFFILMRSGETYSGECIVEISSCTDPDGGDFLIASGDEASGYKFIKLIGNEIASEPSEYALSTEIIPCPRSNMTFWHFEKISDNSYYISAKTDYGVKYLSVADNIAGISDEPFPLNVTGENCKWMIGKNGEDNNESFVCLNDDLFVCDESSYNFTLLESVRFCEEESTEEQTEASSEISTDEPVPVTDQQIYETTVTDEIKEEKEIYSQTVADAAALYGAPSGCTVYFDAAPPEIVSYGGQSGNIKKYGIVYGCVQSSHLNWIKGGASDDKNSDKELRKWKPSADSQSLVLGGRTYSLESAPSGFWTDEGAAAKIYREVRGEEPPEKYRNLYRISLNDGYGYSDHYVNYTSDGSRIPEKYMDGFDYYKEIRFDGWICETGGRKYLFEPGAKVTYSRNKAYSIPEAVIGSDGSISEFSEPVLIPDGTIFRGKWTEVSSPVSFYVNFKGAILDTEGNVAARDVNDFTGCMAVGTLLGCDVSEIPKGYIGDNSEYAENVSKRICSDIIKTADELEFEGPELYIRYYTDCITEKDGTVSLKYNNICHGLSGSDIQKGFYSWMKYTGEKIGLKMPSGNSADISLDNVDSAEEFLKKYEIRWYIMKDQDDGWHIDGVAVAKMSELTITKTFYGLSSDEAHSLLDNAFSHSTGRTQPSGDGFNIELSAIDNGRRVHYLTLKKLYNESDSEKFYDISDTVSDYYDYEKSVSSLYSYEEKEENGVLTSIWTLNIIPLQIYRANEIGYHTAENDYSVSPSWETDGGGVHFSSSETDAFKGGYTDIISFRNYYKKTDTVSFGILKKDNMGERLSGAEFTLMYENGTEIRKGISGSDGMIMFSGLTAGEYTLCETIAPKGFEQDEKTYKIIISESGENGRPEVSSDDLKKVSVSSDDYCIFEAVNFRSDETVKAVKHFSGIRKSSIKALYEDYCIDVSKDGEILYSLKLSDAEVSADSRTFIWYLPDCADDTLKFTEKNYISPDYAAVYVNAEISCKDGSNECVKSESAEIIKKSGYDTVDFTNSYSDEYILKLPATGGNPKIFIAGTSLMISAVFMHIFRRRNIAD